MVEVRALVASDWPAVAAIFAEGIATGNATFETTVPTWEDWDARHLPEHRLVAELDGEVAGWIAVVPYSSRAAYRGVGEESVYVAERARGRGVGRALLAALIASARDGRPLDAAGGDLPGERGRASRCTARSASARWASASGSASCNGAWRDVVLLELRL